MKKVVKRRREGELRRCVSLFDPAGPALGLVRRARVVIPLSLSLSLSITVVPVSVRPLAMPVLVPFPFPVVVGRATAFVVPLSRRPALDVVASARRGAVVPVARAINGV